MAAVSLASVLARGRAAAERLMTDTCLIEQGGDPVDNGDGTITIPYTEVYSGKCRLQQSDGAAASEESGEADLLLVRRTLSLPVATSAGVRKGQRVTVTACVHDPDMTSRTFWIRDEQAKSHATARRLGIEEATG